MEIHLRERGENESEQVPHEGWYTFDVPKSYERAFEKATSDKDKRMVLQASLKHKLIDKLLRAEFIKDGQRASCRTIVVKEFKIGEHEDPDVDVKVVPTAAVVKKKSRAAKVVK